MHQHLGSAFAAAQHKSSAEKSLLNGRLNLDRKQDLGFSKSMGLASMQGKHRLLLARIPRWGN
jgi:hypothetical protein